MGEAIRTTYKVFLPDSTDDLDQNEEYLILKNQEESEKIRFHNYSKIFQVPGLYEKVFCERLKCQLPEVIVNLLEDQMLKEGEDMEKLRVLDLGAGNGMVGEKLNQKEAELIVGADIIPEAKIAAMRDRPEVYDEYYIKDFTSLSVAEINELQEFNFNTLITVAALGFDDIPPQAFMNAFNVIEEGGWVAFNIRDRFLTNHDDTGFKEIMDNVQANYLDIVDSREYIHRYSIDGTPLKYEAIVGHKIKNIPENQLRL